MRESTITRGDVDLHVVEWEGGQPSAPHLLFLHGLSSNSYFWSRVVDLLPDRRIVALDQRAHGASSAPDAGYDPAELAGDAAFVIESIGLGRSVVVGHSWGGTIALQLAADRPDLVSGLALIDSPTSSFGGRMTWDQVQAVMQPPLPVYRSLEEASEAKEPLLGSVWGEDLDRFVAHGLVRDGEGWRLPLTAPIRLQILEAMFFQDYDSLWSRVTVPVWLALGRGSGQGPFYESKLDNARRLAEAVPSLTADWFETGHDIPVEDPPGIAAGLQILAKRTLDADVTQGGSMLA